MNKFWMESKWWSWPAVSAAFSYFSCWFWCFGSMLIARDVQHKKVSNWISGLFWRAENPRHPLRQPDPKSVRREVKIYKGIALFIGIAFLLGFELDLWINVLGNHATLERALLVQLSLFLPFLVFNWAGALGFQWILDRLPQRDEPVKQMDKVSIEEEKRKNTILGCIYVLIFIILVVIASIVLLVWLRKD